VLFENLQALLCIAHHIQEDRFVEPQQRGVQQQEFGRRLLLGLRGFSTDGRWSLSMTNRVLFPTAISLASSVLLAAASRLAKLTLAA
jgi:hypothetical protein